jgi:hypothetical protein
MAIEIITPNYTKTCIMCNEAQAAASGCYAPHAADALPIDSNGT